MRRVLLLVLASALAIGATKFEYHTEPVKIGPGDFAVGYRILGDVLLEERRYQKRGYPLYGVSETVSLIGDGESLITRIEVFSLKEGSSGDVTASLAKGGPGETYASLRFTSKSASGYDYMVKMYAKRPPLRRTKDRD